MPAPRCRPFSVLDAMILVAAAAVGLWLLQLHYRTTESDWRDTAQELSKAKNFHGYFLGVFVVVSELQYVLWPVTPALFVIRLRRPRPTLRRVSRQPGFSACVAILLVTAVSFAGHVFSMAERSTWNGAALTYRSVFGIFNTKMVDYFLMYNLLDVGTCSLGASVLATWGVMAIGGMSRREPGWVDRTGRVLGAFWLLALLLSVSLLQPD